MLDLIIFVHFMLKVINYTKMFIRLNVMWYSGLSPGTEKVIVEKLVRSNKVYSLVKSIVATLIS